MYMHKSESFFGVYFLNVSFVLFDPFDYFDGNSFPGISSTGIALMIVPQAARLFNPFVTKMYLLP